MPRVIDALSQTVPISQFNRGLAGRIFSEVKNSGPKAVMKNNAPEVILVSPDEYKQTNELLNDYLLLTLAVERMAAFDPATLISEEEMDSRLGITQEEIDSISEVEIE